MKKLIVLLIISYFVILSGYAQNNTASPHPVVDERTELLSIAFRLAGAKEYVNNYLKIYTSDVDSCFTLFKEHELIKFIPKIREKYGIGYDAVMSMAIHIEIKNGKISMIDQVAEGSLDKRWTRETAKQFIGLLNDFYTQSHFHNFYTTHKSYYAIAEERFSNVLSKIDFDWFERFYGEKSPGNFHLVISMCNGGGSYGPKVTYKNNSENIYAIIGSWVVDSLGYPVYSNNLQGTIIHEYNHSFCNRLIEVVYPQMKTKAEELFKPVEEKMRQQAYGNNKTMLYEILVRAAVIQYAKEKGQVPLRIQMLISQEQTSGFLWIDQLISLLSDYEQKRDQYRTLKSYMPEIVKLQNSLFPEELKTRFENKAVMIVSTSIPNNATDVDPNTKAITITFDKPMLTNMNGSNAGKRGKDFFPGIKGTEWNKENKKEWTIFVELKPDTEYSISFPARYFSGENGEPVLETYYLDFKTRK